MNNKRGFTLIELMVSITIMVILTLLSYAPYNYYQNKASLKITARAVSQILTESRNMAVNGAIGNDKNVAIGVYFDINNTSNNIVKVFSYPYNMDKLLISNIEGGDIKLIKTLTLSKGVIVNNLGGKPNLLFMFDSITGNVNYYSWAGVTRSSLVENIIPINFSFKGSDSPNLNKTIKYYTNTNIIDY